MFVPVYTVIAYNANLGKVTYKPFAGKGFDLKLFLQDKVKYGGFVTKVDLEPSLEEFPDWAVPDGLDFVEE